MSDLIVSLRELGARFEANFNYEIDGLNEAIAEREEASNAPVEAVVAPRHVRAKETPRITDDDVRQMFTTLVDEK